MGASVEPGLLMQFNCINTLLMRRPSLHLPTPWVDRLGVGASLLCGLHCALAPLLISLIPSALLTESAERTMLFIALALALLSAYHGYRKHQRLSVPASFLTALMLIVAGRRIGEHAAAGHMLIIGGAFTLAMAHVYSAYCCRRSCVRVVAPDAD